MEPKFNFKETIWPSTLETTGRVKDNLTFNVGIAGSFPARRSISCTKRHWPTNWDLIRLGHDGPLSITTVHQVPNNYSYFARTSDRLEAQNVGRNGDKTVIRGGSGSLMTIRSTHIPERGHGGTEREFGDYRSSVLHRACLVPSGFTGGDVRAAHLGDIPRGGNPGGVTTL